MKKPPGVLTAVAMLVGAGVFILTTIAASPFFSRDTPQDGLLFSTLLFAAVTLLIPATRGFGGGFFAALLITTFTNTFDARMWWRPVGGFFMDVTRGPREREARKANTAKWLAVHRGRPLATSGALTLLSNLRSQCLHPLTSDEHGLGVPTDLDGLLNYPDCEPYRATTIRERAEWPKRYFEGDEGWRWKFERLAGTTAAGRPNFRVELRPDASLRQAGPIVEQDGDGRVRVRDRDDASWHMVATPVATMRRLRECVLAAVAMAANDGDTTAVFEYIWGGYYAARACREIRITSATSTENGDHVLDIKSHVPFGVPRAPDTSALFRMVGVRRFEIRSRAWGQRFLLDADGNLHVTTADRDAEVTDPAPAACEEVTSVACES